MDVQARNWINFENASDHFNLKVNKVNIVGSIHIFVCIHNGFPLMLSTRML